jgi:hypothetical protein
MAGIQKFVIYVLTAVLGGTGITVILAGDFTDRVVLIGLGITAATAVVTFLTENSPSQPWAKQAVAILGATVMAFTFAWTDHRIAVDEIPAILLAFLGAWQVGTVANTPARVAATR